MLAKIKMFFFHGVFFNFLLFLPCNLLFGFRILNV